MLAIFDLNGFKQYNDTFGHLAGDDLLIHLAGRLKSTVRSMGKAYRLGGDEFCVVARVSGDECEELVGLAATALSDAHNAVAISASYGVALLPSQTTSAEGALRLADQRMYAQKTQGSRSAARQSTDVLLQVLAERTADPSHHNDNVARLAERVALTLGLNEHAIATVVGAAKLHDIGKVALPDAILDKAGPLNEDEWTFMRRHTLVGERIMLAAPALTGVAELVRFSHERVDGNGYPDQLKAGEIPIGARIIAVCNAFDTMVSERPYAAAKTTAAALAELHRCAGTQFDAEVVTAFEQLEAGGDRAGAGVSGTPPGLLEALSR